MRNIVILATALSIVPFAVGRAEWRPLPQAAAEVVSQMSSVFEKEKFLVEDIKDRPFAVIPLYDLTEGYLWDVPEAVGILPVEYVEGIEPLDAVFEQAALTPHFGGGGWFGGWTDFGQDGGGIRGSVPEPSAWLLMIMGFGLLGGMLRRDKSGVALRG